MFTPFQFGKYYLTERLAVGGMAELFKAKLYGVSGFEKQMVVKQILPKHARNEAFIKMFIDEAKIAVNLHHGNIVPIYELGCIDDIYFIAMEFVDGRDLSEILERARAAELPLTAEHAVYIAIEICKGLDHAHRQTDAVGASLGVIHRDISPPNIMISMQGEVKITDFGIAKATHKLGRTEAGVVKGTFGYMSPEQVRGLPVDHRTDIFSVGVLLWEMLTGRRLFMGESEVEAIERVKEARVPPPSTLNPEVPQALNPLVLKALAKDPTDRFLDANELHLALARLLYSTGGGASASTLSAYVQQLFDRSPLALADEEPTARSRQHRLVPSPSQGGAPPLEEETSRSNPRLKDLEASRRPEVESSPEAKAGQPSSQRTPMDVGAGKGIKINATLALPSLSEQEVASTPQRDPVGQLVIEPAEDKGYSELDDEKTGVYYHASGPKRPEVPELRFPPKEQRVAKRRGPSGLSEVLEAELPPSTEPRSDVVSAGLLGKASAAGMRGAAPFAESETPVVAVPEEIISESAEEVDPRIEEERPSLSELMSLLADPAAKGERPAAETSSQPSLPAGLESLPSPADPGPLPSPAGLTIEPGRSASKPSRSSKPSGIFSNTMRLFVVGFDTSHAREAIDGDEDVSVEQAAIDTDALDQVPRRLHPTLLGWTLIALLLLGAGGLVLYKKTAIFGALRSETSDLLRPEDLKAMRKAPLAKRGTIVLDSEPPGASFFRFVGETPVTVEQLDPGLNHLFLVEREGYSLVYQQVSSAELGSTEPKVQVQLNPVGPGSKQDPPLLEQAGSPTGQSRAMKIESQPPMAMVWQLVGNGEKVALTDVDLSKSVDIKALLPGFRPGITHISAVDFPGDSSTFSTLIRLDREGGGVAADRPAADDSGKVAGKSATPAGDSSKQASPAAGASSEQLDRPRPRRRPPSKRAQPPQLQTPSWAR